MFGLIHGLCEFAFKKPEMRVLLLGVDEAGKTNMLEKMKGTFANITAIPKEQIKTTVGLNVAKLESFGAEFTFWDLGGLERLRPIWLKYYREAHGIFFVVDSSDDKRIDEARLVFNRVLKHEDLKHAPVLILANKIDVSGPEGFTMVKTAFEISALNSNTTTKVKNGKEKTINNNSSDNNTYSVAKRVIGVSAYTGQGIKEAVEWMVNEVNGGIRQRELAY